MGKKEAYISISKKEVIFQIVLHALVFLFYSFDKSTPQIKEHHIPFFLNYAFANFIISYLLLPHFFYKKKYLQFTFYIILVFISTIFIEEEVLEQIYFPDTRGGKFNLLYTFIDVLPIIAILSGFKFAWDALGKQKEVEALKTAVKESELRFLRSQINPHFLFNNLNNLYAHSIENSPKTPDIILELSSVLRYMLYECKAAFVPLSKEIEQLGQFIKLNEYQIEDRGQITFNVSDISSNYVIAPLILTVFVENAFKHSQSSQSENIIVDIRVELQEAGRLDFFCKNNFQPMTNTANLPKGIGLKNVQKRLQLLYPNAHELNIQEKENQYEVYLSIQLKKAST